MNKMGSYNFCYYNKKLPFDDVVISKGQTNSMTEQSVFKVFDDP